MCLMYSKKGGQTSKRIKYRKKKKWQNQFEWMKAKRKVEKKWKVISAQTCGIRIKETKKQVVIFTQV